jgi:hypothetical protein
MKWMTALRRATPVWIVTIGAVGASMFLTNFAAEVGAAEAIKRLALVAVAALPLIAFLVKATSDDFMRFKAAFSARDADGGDD